MKEKSQYKCKFCGDITEESRSLLNAFFTERKCVKCNNDKFWYKVIEVLA
jgi:hypothetical protein